MDRFVPDEYRSGKLLYLITIRGIGARRERLMANLAEEALFEDSTKKIMKSHWAFPIYFSVEGDDAVEFDIYKAADASTRDTHTAYFRKELGNLTTLLLQTGYTVTAVSNPEFERRVSSLTDF